MTGLTSSFLASLEAARTGIYILVEHAKIDVRRTVLSMLPCRCHVHIVSGIPLKTIKSRAGSRE